MAQEWEILDKFTGHLRDTLVRAMALANETGSVHVEPLHLLYSLSLQKGSVAHEILQGAKLSSATILRSFANPSGTQSAGAGQTAVVPDLSAGTRRAIEKAMLLAVEYEHRHVGTEHLLCAIIILRDPGIRTLLKQQHITEARITQQLDMLLSSISRFPDIEDADGFDEPTDEPQMLPAVRTVTAHENKKKRPQTALGYFAVNLTHPSAQKDIDPVIGREEEIARIMHILCRRTKNNPLLIGDAGVGKTAIVEGLAKKIAAGDVPDQLLGKQIHQLDMGLLLSGTMYRGEFEARIKQIIDEIKNDPRMVLFIDELHTIVGAGSTQGTLDAANMLKPALARGHLRCIGATTADEYRKYLEADAALERRFQPLYVEEPTAEKTREILHGVKKYYENFHKVIITPSALERAVELSVRYLHGKRLPDKAIDVLDEAAAAARLKTSGNESIRALYQLQRNLEDIQAKKTAAIFAERYDTALKNKAEEDAVRKKIRVLRKNSAGRTNAGTQVTGADVAAVVAHIAGIPLERLKGRTAQCRNLASKLSETIMGQAAALGTIENHLVSAAADLQSSTGPFASFLFVGPSGTGKSTAAEALAEHLYGHKDALLRLDMSEYSEGFGVSKLLGAPAGYVGFREASSVLERLRHRPHSVVVFDHIDKAHRDVLSLIPQILEEGELNLSSNKRVTFAHATLIITLTVEKSLFSARSIGFGGKSTVSASLPDGVQSMITDLLGNKTTGHLDAIVPFYPLSPDALRAIFDLRLRTLNVRLKTKNKTLSLERALVDYFLNRSEHRDGGRVVDAAFKAVLLPALARSLRTHTKSSLRGRIKNGAIVVE